MIIFINVGQLYLRTELSLTNRILERPFFYSLSQNILAPGAHWMLNRKIGKLVENLPQKGMIIDVGCGPKSWLWHTGLCPVGVDISYPYVLRYKQAGCLAIHGSAYQLPFQDNSITGAFSLGLLHHLNDTLARASVEEMMRVVKPGGWVIVLDAVLPRKKWTRPIATIIRKKDRGTYMRNQSQVTALFPVIAAQAVKRYTYSLTGLEIVEIIIRKKPVNFTVHNDAYQSFE